MNYFILISFQDEQVQHYTIVTLLQVQHYTIVTPLQVQHYAIVTPLQVQHLCFIEATKHLLTIFYFFKEKTINVASLLVLAEMINHGFPMVIESWFIMAQYSE